MIDVVGGDFVDVLERDDHQHVPGLHLLLESAV